VRKICPHCKIEFKPTAQLLEESAIPLEAIRGVTMYEGRGCIECNGTGFFGRMAITELLDLSDHIRTLILEKRPASEIKKAAQGEGMTFLRESALKKVIAGETTLKEVNKVTFVE
jgi:type IV pilus assembly protein PilB